MPLVPQQDVVSVRVPGGNPDKAVAELKKALWDYPPVRIISITMCSINAEWHGYHGTELVAVVETMPLNGPPPAG